MKPPRNRSWQSESVKEKREEKYSVVFQNVHPLISLSPRKSHSERRKKKERIETFLQSSSKGTLDEAG